MSEERSLSPTSLENLSQFTDNHGSFKREFDGAQPAFELLQDLVDQGFATLHVDRDAARGHIGAEVVVSPLGDVTKPKPDGSLKHRLIQDFRASRVNEASVLGGKAGAPEIFRPRSGHRSCQQGWIGAWRLHS